MKKSHKKIVIAVSVLLFVVASGTAYYKFVYKKTIKESDAKKENKGGKTNDNGGTPISKVDKSQPAKV